MTRHRRAGGRWRLLVHTMLPGGNNGASHHVKSHPDEGRLPRSVMGDEARRTADEIGATYGITTIVPGTEFDELVVGRWLHVEQMDPRSVLVELEDPQPGVRYRLGGREVS